VPSITVGIPFYNCQDTLADAIRSVFAQTFQDWQLVLVDDGSSDGSLQIANSLSDSRVRVFSDGVNKGIGARRKQMVDLAQSEYIAWQDADDLMHSDRLERQLAFLEANPGVHIVDCWCYLIDPDDNVTGLQRSDPAEPSLIEMVKRPLMINGCSLARLEMYRAFQFDNSMRRTEDWDLWIRAIEHCSFAHLEQPLYYRRDLRSAEHSSIAYQLRELRFARRLLLRHGPRVLGWAGTGKVLARYYLRAITRSALFAARLRNLVGESRRSVITPEEAAEGDTGIQRIKGTIVAGLS